MRIRVHFEPEEFRLLDDLLAEVVSDLLSRNEGPQAHGLAEIRLRLYAGYLPSTRRRAHTRPARPASRRHDKC